MNPKDLPSISQERRYPSPAITPQALAWHSGALWMGSRDLRRIYKIEAAEWKVVDEFDPPGIPWAAVSTGDALQFTIGEGADDDRYIRAFNPATGFAQNGRMTCPDFTGSYLSYDGEHLYLSQWYKHRILELDHEGETVRTVDVGAEISGHVHVDGWTYVLRGTEQDGEDWYLARLDPGEQIPIVSDVARVPFACRSLTFDGTRFWANHRAGNEIVSFGLPE